MRFLDTQIPGVWLVDSRSHHDDRGAFTRIYCREEFARHDLSFQPEQSSISYNREAGTLRGMHYQKGSDAECKLVRCISGCIYDVVVDLREDSGTFRAWYGLELSADNGLMLFVPAGIAHGFQTLSDDAQVLYQISAPFIPEAARGVRFDDPAFDISWPRPVTRMSSRDRQFADFVG